jgi:hypothetical protein
MAIKLELGLRADGKAIAVGGKAWRPSGVGTGYPSVGSNQAGNVRKALGTIRLNHDGTIEKFVPEEADGFDTLADVVAADEATGTD